MENRVLFASLCRMEKSIFSAILFLITSLLLPQLILSNESTDISDNWRTSRSSKIGEWVGNHPGSDSGNKPEIRIESSIRTLPSSATKFRGSDDRGSKGPYINIKRKTSSADPNQKSSLKLGIPDSSTASAEVYPGERRKRIDDKKPLGPSGSSHFLLKDGGYEGLVVEVSDQVSQDDCRIIVDGLQTLLMSWSNALYTATEGSVYLRTASVSIPNHWPTRGCHPLTSSQPVSPSTQAPQIKLEPPHPVFGDSPWTQQTKGCGVQGDFIQFGVGFLQVSNSSASHASRAGKALVGEWGKYRWGLFSESGHLKDPLYPTWIRKGSYWEENVCTDSKVHNLMCHPDEAHHCSWPTEEDHQNASSSLLALPYMPQVTKFCDRGSHNTQAQTKHNVLCNGLSAWQVMNMHPDFNDTRSNPRGTPPRPPTVHFFKKPTNRFVLLIEDTVVMNVQRRWEFVRKAVRRVVVYDLPNGVEVALVVFNAKAREASPLSKLEATISDLRERVGSSLPRNPSGVRSSQACILCGLKKGIEVLQADGYSAQGANIVLVTSGTQGRENEADDVSKMIQDYSLRLLLVLYPLTERPAMPAPDHALVPVAKKSGGRVFTVMDEGVGLDSKVSMLVSLMEALTAAVAAGGATTPVLLHSVTYKGGIASLSSGTFSLDESVASQARFAIYYYDLAHVGNTIRLTAPSGATFASVNMQEEDGDVNMISVNLNNAERGVWRYKVENRADSHQALHIQVTSFPNIGNEVTVNVWTNQQLHSFSVTSNYQKPIIIFGEVKIGATAVMNAGVMAILQRLGTNATGGTYPEVRVPLLDLGTGDPDITRGDGIYSRYAPPLEGPARYSMLLYVEADKAVLPVSQAPAKDHDLRHHKHALNKEVHWAGYNDGNEWILPSCCGSVVPFGHTRQTPPFHRQITGPTLDIRLDHVLHREKVAPARIMDLVAWVNTSNGQVVLEWTAVGGDRDWGRAHAYEGFIAPSKSQATYKCSGQEIKGLPIPSASPKREIARISIPLYEHKGQWACIRAIDKDQNRGPPSNPAAIWRPLPPSTDRVTIRARGSGGSILSSSHGGYFSRIGGFAEHEKIAVISGCIGGIILVGLLVVVYWYCLAPPLKRRLNRRRHPQNNSEKPSTCLVNGDSVTTKSASRGSVLVELGSEGPALDGQGSHSNNTPQNERRNHSCSPDIQQINCVTSHEAQFSAQPSSRRNVDEREDTANKALSLSIPDITKVECNPRDTELESVPSPQFYTLGRHSKSSSVKNHSPIRIINHDSYRPSDIKFGPPPVNYEPIGGLQYFNQVRPHHPASDTYSDGPDDNDVPDQLFCDDRASSPPPPAPSDNSHSYSRMQRHSIARM